MVMNYKEVPRGTSQAYQKQYADGIAQMNELAQTLLSQGLLPERFAPEPSKLHPSLEEKVRQETITIGGKTSQELLSELTQNGINVGSYARSMMENPDFTTLPGPQQIDLVRLQVRDLGIKKNLPTTDDIYKRAQELGLNLCPAEVGPQYRLQYNNQPNGEWFVIGMKPITDSGGYPRVFALGRRADGLWLLGTWATPGRMWGPGREFVFSLRK